MYLGGKNARWIGGTIEDNYGPGVVDAGEGNAFMGATVRGNNRPRRWGARDDISGALRGISGPRPVPTRDTALKDALAYACAGAWNVPLEERYTDQSEVDAFNYRLREMQKDFASDRLTVWGRERMMDAFSSEGWVLIEPEFWKLNKISWTSLFSGGLTRTESRSGLGSDDQYEDLMVSRAQIEERWPSD